MKKETLKELLDTYLFNYPPHKNAAVIELYVKGVPFVFDKDYHNWQRHVRYGNLNIYAEEFEVEYHDDCAEFIFYAETKCVFVGDLTFRYEDIADDYRLELKDDNELRIEWR